MYKDLYAQPLGHPTATDTADLPATQNTDAQSPAIHSGRHWHPRESRTSFAPISESLHAKTKTRLKGKHLQIGTGNILAPTTHVRSQKSLFPQSLML